MTAVPYMSVPYELTDAKFKNVFPSNGQHFSFRPSQTFWALSYPQNISIGSIYKSITTNCYTMRSCYKSPGDRLQNLMLSLQIGEHRLLFFSHINFDIQKFKGAIKVLCIVILQMKYPLTCCNWTYGVGKNDQGWLSSFQILVSFKWPSIDLGCPQNWPIYQVVQLLWPMCLYFALVYHQPRAKHWLLALRWHVGVCCIYCRITCSLNISVSSFQQGTSKSPIFSPLN